MLQPITRLAACLACGLSAIPVSATSIYLVRHAEKLTGTDPALSDCGQARAAALAEYFRQIPLQAVYSTPYQRTQQTAATVAQSQQLAVRSYHPAQPQQLQQALPEHAPAVLIVGHSNTIPELVTLLSGLPMAPLTEQDYDLLYKVTLGSTASVTISRQAFRCQTPLNQ